MNKKETKPVIGIIGGKGRMGNWFKFFFEKQGLEVIISDIETPLSNKEVAKKVDIVIVSVPISVTPEVIREIRGVVKKDALLTDLTSLKTEPLKEMSMASSGVLGMHPLFGPLQVNLKKQTIVFCRKKDNKFVPFLKELFKANGANVIEISSREHDKQVAYLQALLSFTNINLAHFLALKKFKSIPDFLTPNFKIQELVVSRILSQNPNLYAEIQMFNPYFKEISKEYIEKIKEFQKSIEAKDYKNFDKKFKQAHSYWSTHLKVDEKNSVEVLKVIDRQSTVLGKVKKRKNGEGKAGFLGPEGTFSWTAAKEILPETVSLDPFPTINEVFNALVNEKIGVGVVPMENTTGGLVSETIYCLIDHPVFVINSFRIPIEHCLASSAKKLTQISVIKSHPQALSQCKEWIYDNLPEARLETSSSTVAPVLQESNKNMAFILPYLTAKKFKLNILAKKIQDQSDNSTRFLLISRNLGKPTKLGDRNTFLFLAVYDRIGVLRDLLNVFVKRKINLCALHSIPTPNSSWDYLFFLEVEKSYFDKNFKEVAKELEEYCPFVRVVGIS